MELGDRRRAVETLSNELALPPGVTIRVWREEDFPAVQRLSAAEGWTTPTDRPDDALEAWRRSWPAVVIVTNEVVIGFIRALSDGSVTTYVAELLVAPEWLGHKLASALLETTQRLCPGSRLDLLATHTSRDFYEHAGFRPFAGFRFNWTERTSHDRDAITLSVADSQHFAALILDPPPPNDRLRAAMKRHMVEVDDAGK